MIRLTRIKPSTKANARRLRKEMADAERLLRSHLRRHQMAGLRFRRQHPLGPFVVDFVCIEAALVIEVDGGQHGEHQAEDAASPTSTIRPGILPFWPSAMA